MRRLNPSDDREEMTFAEFCDFIFSLGEIGPDGSAPNRFYHFLKSGCSEAEAKRWLALHIWDFEPEMQKTLTLALAADALHQAAKREQAESDPSNIKKR